MSCNFGDVPDMGVNSRPDLLMPGSKDPGGGPGPSSPGGCDRIVEKFSLCDAVLTVLAMVGYMSDLGSDIFVACMHYRYRNYWWFGLTVSFVVLPSLTVAAFSFAWYISDWKEFHGKGDGTRRWIIRYIFVFLQLAPLMRYIDMLVYGIREMKGDPLNSSARFQQEKRQREEIDSALLRLFKSFMEAAPQLTLQLYILIMEGVKGNVVYEIGQAVSCTTSLCSLSWSLVVYQKTLRNVLPNKRALSYRAMVPMFLWRLFTIGARVVCFALFASAFSYWIFIVVGCHWWVMFVWVFLQKNKLCTNSAGEVFFKVVMATVHVFCFFNLCEGRTRLRYAIFYTLVYLENMAMMVAWHRFLPTESPWYVLPAMVSVLGLFFVGVLFQVVYYVRCHPNNENSETMVRIWVPWSELEGTACAIGD